MVELCVWKTLYKLTKTGAVQYWSIGVEGNEISIEFGQVGTSSPQITKEVISEGKNLGRSNATTPAEQAYLEAAARWTKQKDRNGYVTSLERAQAGEKSTDAPVPMLAHTWEKQGHKLKFPLIASPKLDGLRCMARKVDGVVTLYSRKGTVFTSVPHINKALEGLNFDLLDGELYNHKFKDNFEHITHLVRQQTPCAGHEEVEFHIFDMVTPEPYFKRLASMSDLMLGTPGCLCLVAAISVDDLAEIEQAYDTFAEAGYEGAMLRQPESLYEHSRSYGLQKYKKFLDDEFEIVDVVEGRGRLAGHGIFVCKTKEGTQFQVKMVGDTKQLKTYLEQKQDYTGKQLTVKYQGISTKNSVPRFPVGQRVHLEEKL